MMKCLTPIVLILGILIAGDLPMNNMEYSRLTTRDQFVVIGWNDLGMHCANQNFANLAVLPPYNTVRAQVVLKPESGFPQIITEDIRLNYSIPGNTFSVGKTNFWEYAQDLFGLPEPLPDDIGLTGLGLSGEMSVHDGYFEASGIPVTPFTDDDLVNEAPYQLIHLVAERISTGEILAETDVTIPVSNEIGCVQGGCHSSETGILWSHENEDGYNPADTPILCAECHASNALGTTGDPEARFLSYRIHEEHKEDAGPLYSIQTCYKCHPGPDTQCFRGVMADGIDNPMICQDCHGTMYTIYQSINAGREPWLDEPACGAAECHGAEYAEQPNTLFRESTGHGGLYCSACHGSPHAIYPSREDNDNVQNVSLQGHAGTLGTCTVCHTSIPGAPGPHGYIPDPMSFPGDVNTDGSLDVTDIVLMVGFILGTQNPSPEIFSIADVNQDGSLDVLDIIQVVQMIIGDQ